jgi:hypothetical protein
VAVFKAEFAQAEALSRPQFFDEGSKHSFVLCGIIITTFGGFGKRIILQVGRRKANGIKNLKKLEKAASNRVLCARLAFGLCAPAVQTRSQFQKH